MLEDRDLADSQSVCEFLHRRRVAVGDPGVANELKDVQLPGCKVHLFSPDGPPGSQQRRNSSPLKFGAKVYRWVAAI